MQSTDIQNITRREVCADGPTTPPRCGSTSCDAALGELDDKISLRVTANKQVCLTDR